MSVDHLVKRGSRQPHKPTASAHSSLSIGRAKKDLTSMAAVYRR